MLTLAALAGTFAPFVPSLVIPDVQKVPATIKSIDPSDRDAKPPVSPRTLRITLGEVPKTVSTPAGLVDATYGTAKAAERDVAVLVGKSDAGQAHPDVILIDANFDGKFGDAERHAMTVEVTTQRNNEVAMSKPVPGSLAGGAQFNAMYMASGSRPATASLAFNQYLEATLPVGAIAVVDKDFDGTFGSPGDAWVITPTGGRAASEYALMQLDESVFVDGHRYRITLGKDVLNVSSEAAAGPDPKDAAAQRERAEHMWMERFEPTRKEFFEQRGLDATRPVATEPIQWRYVTYAEAVAMGVKENKPVFIDVMAFWCVWCYRMDWCTYTDAEVTKVLNEDFIPVKIIQEQDLVGDYDLVMKEKLQARGIPAMGVFDGKGNAVHTIGGWMTPEKFLEQLAEGKTKFAAQ